MSIFLMAERLSGRCPVSQCYCGVRGFDESQQSDTVPEIWDFQANWRSTAAAIRLITTIAAMLARNAFILAPRIDGSGGQVMAIGPADEVQIMSTSQFTGWSTSPA